MFYPAPKPTLQQRICSYIKSISREACSSEDAESELSLVKNWFIIGGEVKRDKGDDQYFNLFFLDACFEDIWCTAALTVFKTGILNIDNKGYVKILDATFKPMAVNVEFKFHAGKLELVIDDLMIGISTCTIM